jgi:stress response protein YsnF
VTGLLPSKNIQSIIGGTLYGADNEKLGRISQVFVDAVDGHPTWAEIHVGALGRHSTFVPLDDAAWEHDDVTVPYTKDDVKNAPRPDVDGGLSPSQEDELRRHYRHEDDAHGVVDGDGDNDGDADNDGVRDDKERHDRDDNSQDRSEQRQAPAEPGLDDDGVLWEERVVVHKERVPVAKVHLEKQVVTEEREVTADVQKERIAVDETVTRNDPDGAVSGTGR